MKLLLFTPLFIFLNTLSAQLRPVPITQTETVIGAQLGFFGVAAYGELPLGYRTALRGEVGTTSSFSGGSARKTQYYIIPAIVISPRWYYNLVRRAERGRPTAKNTANFLSVRTSVNPGVELLSNDPAREVYGHLTVIPSWGIRRYWGKVSFETGAGVGLIHYFNDSVGKRTDATAAVYLRFGI